MTDEIFYQLPAVMPVPHRPEGKVDPPPSMEADDVERWAKQIYEAVDDLMRWSTEMHSSIYDNYIPQTDRIENLTMVGENLNTRPDAIGSRRFFYHRPNRRLYLDVRYGDENFWDLVFSDDAAIIVLDTTNFDKILGPTDSDLQVAMETLDDHIHAAEEITVDSAGFVDILGITDDEVQRALETLDVHTHPLGTLEDVDVTGAGVGSLLVFDGNNWVIGTGGSITVDHDDLLNKGVYRHVEIDAHIDDDTIHFTLPRDATAVAVNYYEVVADDRYILVTVADDAEVVLPDAVANDGRAIYIKRTMDNQYDVEVTVTGGGLVEGGASFFLRRQYDAITCVAVDGEWWIY
mgnify:CR=1 FL=1